MFSLLTWLQRQRGVPSLTRWPADCGVCHWCESDQSVITVLSNHTASKRHHNQLPKHRQQSRRPLSLSPSSLHVRPLMCSAPLSVRDAPLHADKHTTAVMSHTAQRLRPPTPPHPRAFPGPISYSVCGGKIKVQRELGFPLRFLLHALFSPPNARALCDERVSNRPKQRTKLEPSTTSE